MAELINTVDIIGKEWFDKINGNSYFSAQIIIDYKMPSEKTIKIPLQYGYGDNYIYEASRVLTEHNYISMDYGQALWKYCEDNNIILRTTKYENCLKRDVSAFGR